MQSEKIDLLATALCEAQKTIKNAHKDSANPFFKSKYADLTSVWDACREALNANGLSVVQTLNEMNLVTRLLHVSGQWVSGSCPLVNVKDMQSLGSAITYARRYGLAAITGVTAEDDDGNMASQPKSPGDIKSPKPQNVPTLPELKDPGSYICQVKKFLGKRLDSLADFEILGYIDWLKMNTEMKFAEQKEFIKYGEAYLTRLQGKKDPSEPPPVEDFDYQWGTKK